MKSQLSLPVFVLSLVVDDEVIGTYLQHGHTLRLALIRAHGVAKGIPSCWVGIRLDGRIVGEVETDWRGKLSSVNVHANYRPMKARRYWFSVVTAINPAWLEMKGGA